MGHSMRVGYTKALSGALAHAERRRYHRRPMDPRRWRRRPSLILYVTYEGGDRKWLVDKWVCTFC